MENHQENRDNKKNIGNLSSASDKNDLKKNHPADGIEETDKYLAMEQQGVTYTHEGDPTINSDQMDFTSESRKRKWNDLGGNSRNSEAFNQDDYLLDDNIDLDEDQNKSISSDDEDFEETNERY